MAITSTNKRPFIPNIFSTAGQKMLQDQMDWMWGQLMGRLTMKSLAAEVKDIIEAKAEATTLEDLAAQLDELTAVSDGALTIWYSATDPAGKAEYDIWFRTTPQPYLVQRWIGGVYVDISSTATARALILAYGAQQTADGKIKVYRQNDAPTGLTATDDGDLWFDTNDSNKLYAWNGSTLAWVSAQDTHLDDTVNAMKTEIIQAANELRLRASLEATNDFGVAIETVMAEVLITAGNITAEVTNKTAHVSSLPPALEDLYLGKLWVKTDTDEHLWWKAIVMNTLRSYAAQIIGTSAVFNDLSDDTEIDLTIKTTTVQETGTITPTTPRAISGKSVVYAHHAKRNILKPGTTVTSDGVTMTVAADGTVTLNGTCTASAGSPVLFTVLMGFYLNGQVTFSANNTVAYGSDLQMRLLESSSAQVASPTTNFGVTTVGAKATFTLNNQYVYGWAIRVQGGVTYTNATLKPQLEPGDTALGYVPYDGVLHTFTPDATLYGLTGKEDEIGSDGHVIHKTALVTLVGGTEAWALSLYQPTDTTLVRFTLPLVAIALNPAGMCSRFPWVAIGAQSGERASGHSTAQQINIWILKSRLAGWSDALTDAQKVTLFKNWLASNNTQVLYQLATPTTASVAPVQINGEDGYNVISATTVVNPVTVDYLGSGWGLVSRDSRRVYASSKFVIDETGATIHHVLLDGITPYEAWSHLYGGGLEIFETSTGKLIGGLTVRNGKVVLAASALSDPRVNSDFLCLVFTENGTVSGVATTKFGLKISKGSVDALSFSASAPNSDPTNVSGHISSRGRVMRLSTYTLDPGTDYAEILLSPSGSLGLTAKKTVSGTPYYAALTFYPDSTKIECNGHFNPVDNGVSNLGNSSTPTRWRRLYCTQTVDVSSDERTKQDIQDVEPDLLYKLRPRAYRLKANPEKLHFGLIAQEVFEALKEQGMPDADLYGDENPENLSVRYGELHALETAAIQQLRRKIEALEAEPRWLRTLKKIFRR